MKLIKPYKRQKRDIINVKAEAALFSELLKLMNLTSHKNNSYQNVFISL